jgi:hypothetical protein
MSNAVFCGVTPFGSCNKERFGGTYRLHHQAENSELETILVVNGN